MKIWYTVPDHCEESRYSCEASSASKHTQVMMCCMDYNNNHDGWESTWPLTFALHDSEDGPEVARFKVEKEMVPTFSAREVKCK